MSEDDAYPRYMIRVRDDRPKQLRDTLPLRLEIRTSNGNIRYIIVTDRRDVPSIGINILDVNGRQVPENWIVELGGVPLGFVIRDDATLSDFDFTVIKQPPKPDFPVVIKP